MVQGSTGQEREPSSDARLLRDTLDLALARGEVFPARFYDLLLGSHPGVRPLFHRHPPEALLTMFAQKLSALVDHVEDPAWLERELGALAASHRDYHVTAEMYPWVGDALIQALVEACGAAWTPEAERAWRDAYASIALAMLSTPP